MAYVPSAPPVEYSGAYLQQEFQRIANAYNFQRGVGELLFDLEAIHAPQVLGIVPTKIINWDFIGPDATVSDGPVMTAPLLAPDDHIILLQDGIYQVGFYVGFEHPQNETFIFEIYVNGVRTFVGSIIEAAAAIDVSSLSTSAILSLENQDVIELRGACLTGDEIVTMRAGAMFALKEMDKRTRVS